MKDTKSNFKAVTKKATIQYRKNGNEFVEYWLLDKDDFIKKVSPAGFKRTPVQDITADTTFKKMCKIKIEAIQFNKRLDILRELRNKNLHPITTDNAREALELITEA